MSEGSTVHSSDGGWKAASSSAHSNWSQLKSHPYWPPFSLQKRWIATNHQEHCADFLLQVSPCGMQFNIFTQITFLNACHYHCSQSPNKTPARHLFVHPVARRRVLFTWQKLPSSPDVLCPYAGLPRFTRRNDSSQQLPLSFRYSSGASSRSTIIWTRYAPSTKNPIRFWINSPSAAAK